MSRVDLWLYLVLDSTLCGDRPVAKVVAAAVRGGVTAVQVREPQATTRELCALTTSVREAVAGTAVPVLVNDRLDVALATGADGVHLGQSDLDPVAARRIGGPELLVGLSVGTPAEVAEAGALAAGTVDYLGVGPVHATATKPDAGAPLGTEGTAALVGTTALPCVAIGGIGPGNVAAVRGTGVDGVAVVSAICAAADPGSAARDLLAVPR